MIENYAPRYTLRVSSFLSLNRVALLRSALFPLLVPFSLPALYAQTAAYTEERPVTQIAPQFSKTELNFAKTDPDYFTINPDSIKLKLEEVKEEPDINYVTLQERPHKDLSGIAVTIEKIVNVASKIWQIVEKNVPAVDIETKYAAAYPEGITSASQLALWSSPKSYVYGFHAENLYGSVMVKCRYKVTYTYNGAYKDRGRYLTAVTVIPETVSVGWGYRFYMSASVSDSTIANVGTDLDPVAAMQLKLNWKMSTAVSEVNGVSVDYMQGDGFYEEIANPWKVERKMKDMKAASPLLTPEKVF